MCFPARSAVDLAGKAEYLEPQKDIPVTVQSPLCLVVKCVMRDAFQRRTASSQLGATPSRGSLLR
jgi:hypothetical protein